jgi:hypothetical protein
MQKKMIIILVFFKNIEIIILHLVLKMMDQGLLAVKSIINFNTKISLTSVGLFFCVNMCILKKEQLTTEKEVKHGRS